MQIYEQPLQFGDGDRADRIQYEEVRMVPYQHDRVLCMVRDISEAKSIETVRQQAEAALKKSADSLAEAQRIAQVGNWEFDLVTQTVIWSEELFRLYGHNSAQWQPTYEEFQQQVPAEDWQPFERAIQQAIAEGIPYAIEHRVIRPDGTLRYALSKGEAVVSSHGQVIKLLGTTQDITDRKHIELEICRSHDLREAIFNESADALLLVDPETLLTVDCNDRTVELFEANHKQAILSIEGHTLQRQPFTPEELTQIQHELETQGYWSRELEYVTLKGNHFWGNIAAKQITVADQHLNLVRVTDISDRKRAEANCARAKPNCN